MLQKVGNARLPTQAEASALGLNEGVPSYLSTYYWWAYVHPHAVRVFERQWLANIILWGNYGRLRDAALSALGTLSGRTLQVACAYGDLTTRMCERLKEAGGTLDVVDVLPIQIENLRRKLHRDDPVTLMEMNSTSLQLPDAQYDRALLFFLLHEQPANYRERTLSEAYRVVKPGGHIVIVDYALPRWWNPLRYLWRPLLATLEPFALDLWRHDLTEWFPAEARNKVRKKTFFGGLYQKIIITR
jgi:ubiquinone/menaquinone biosynthesis C-methylase UbiE